MMETIKLVVVLGVMAVAYGVPLNDQQGKNLITGVFIPSDAFKNLQDRANAGLLNNQQPMQGKNQIQNPQPNYQPVNTNQPQYQPLSTNLPQYQSTVMTNQQPTNNQPILFQALRENNQVPLLTNQPTMNNQPSNIQPMSNQPRLVYTQLPLTANREPNQPIMVLTNQPNNQPNQPIYVQPPNQQPTQMIFATNPSNENQMQGTLVQSPNQNQPGSTVYTLIPLNGENNNMNTNADGSYLIPVQSGNPNPIIISTGK